MHSFCRYNTAHTAEARAAKGEFVCMGRVLVPFAFVHEAMLMESLGEDFDFIDDLDDFALLEIASVICSQTHPTLDIGIPETEAEEAAFAAKCATLDLDAESERFGKYITACYRSSPRILPVTTKDGGAPRDLRAPIGHVIAAQLTTWAPSVTLEDIMHRWPIGKTLWLYWSIRELREEHSHIAPTDNPIQLSDEEKAEKERIELLVGRAIALRNKRAKDIVDPDVLAGIETDTAELIKRIEAGEVTEVDV